MKTSCAGSSLIESMVALAVFAVGSAAAGSWVSSSMATDAKASRLTAVVSAAANLQQRVRANARAAAAGHYEVGHPGVLAMPWPDCAHGCDATALAADDLHRFRERLLAAGGAGARFSLHCRGRVGCELEAVWRGSERYVLSFAPVPVSLPASPSKSQSQS